MTVIVVKLIRYSFCVYLTGIETINVRPHHESFIKHVRTARNIQSKSPVKSPVRRDQRLGKRKIKNRPRLPVYQLQFQPHVHPDQFTITHIQKKNKKKTATYSIDQFEALSREIVEVWAGLSQYSQRVALSTESTLAFSPPAWSPFRYFPPSTRMAILLRSQNSNRNWTGVELLHATAVSSPTLQYFPWESGQTTHT